MVCGTCGEGILIITQRNLKNMVYSDFLVPILRCLPCVLLKSFKDKLMGLKSLIYSLREHGKVPVLLQWLKHLTETSGSIVIRVYCATLLVKNKQSAFLNDSQ